MRILLINPWDRTITEQEVSADWPSFYTEIYELMSFTWKGAPNKHNSEGPDIHYKVDAVEPLRIGDREVILVDENAGMFPHIPFKEWTWHGAYAPIKGRAVVVGEAGEEFAPCVLEPSYIARFLKWL